VTAIPQPKQHTVAAIYAAYVEDNGDRSESIGIPAGSIGAECARAIWYEFRYASPPEQLDGRKHRIFRRGDIEEDRLVADLERVGITVSERQAKVRAVGGHVRGRIDGQVQGLPEAPVTVHLLECKSSNDKKFKELSKKKVREAKPEHWATMQLYMHERGLSRALYICTNKNDEEIYTERVEYDAAEALRLLARAEWIVRQDDPPPRLHEDPNAKAAFVCGFCRHFAICHGGAFARVNCRTCLHSTPEMGGDAHWSCARWSKPLGWPDEQMAGCETHLYLPGLVPGIQVDANEQAETVTYQLADDSKWVDGATEKQHGA
jgi:hypothetical protein